MKLKPESVALLLEAKKQLDWAAQTVYCELVNEERGPDVMKVALDQYGLATSNFLTAIQVAVKQEMERRANAVKS